MMKWPPRSPDLTPLDFYFWGYVKGKVYVPPLAQTIDQLKIRIRAAIQTVTIDVLIKVWANMDRRLQMVIEPKADTSRTWGFKLWKNKHFHTDKHWILVSLINTHLKLQLFIFLCFALSLICCIEMFPFIQNSSFLGTFWDMSGIAFFSIEK